MSGHNPDPRTAIHTHERLHLREAAHVLSDILTTPRPADAVLDHFFRARKQMGATDRRVVVDSVYDCLRHLRLYGWLAGTDSPSSLMLLAVHWLRQGVSARNLEKAGVKDDLDAVAARVHTMSSTAAPFAVRTDLPDGLTERLCAQLGETETLALAAALNRPATLDLRVNTLKATREQAQDALAADGIRTEPTPYSPWGLRAEGHANLSRSQVFQDGQVEVQDEGSQLLPLLLEPRRHEMVVDFCAGAGGKTLVLGMLMNGQGSVYAFDVSAKRLARFKPRLKRSGLQNVRTVAIAHERDDRVRRLEGKIDRVLVDAPCSGTGTLRRHPEIKWRPLDLGTLTETQSRILAAAARLVKSGGRLVYATCSLLREENEDIIRGFLESHPAYRELNASEILTRRHVALDLSGPAFRLFPHRHGTDGFFAAVLERG